jgi:RHS repeat-associated protein
VNGSAIVVPVSGSASFNIAATASALDGFVTNVHFLKDGAALGSVATVPYVLPVSNVPPGNFSLTAVADDNNGLSTTSAPVSITVFVDNVPPTVAMIAPTNGLAIEVLTNGTTNVTLSASASDFYGHITQVTFRQNGVDVGIVTNAPYNLSLTNVPIGVYSYIAVASNDFGLSSTSAPVNFIVFVDGGPPMVAIVAPADGGTITAPTNVIGTASSPILQSYQLQLRLETPDGTNAWSTLTNGSASVVNGALGPIDPTLLLNGVYELRLMASDIKGRTAQTDTNTFIIDRNLKIGHFTMSFNDLAVPMPGLPIQIVRTYDSRAATAGVQGDFGIGWTMDIKNVRLQKNRPLGRNWEETTTGDAFGLSLVYHLDPILQRIVTVTFPDGKVEKFLFQPKPMDQYLLPIDDFGVTPQWRFTPIGNTRGTLVPATFDEEDGQFIEVVGAVPGPVDLYDFNFFFTGTWTDQQQLDRYPTLFRYTSAEGYRYLIDEIKGLQSVTDPNGNTLLINNDRLIWTNSTAGTSSLSVALQRDAQGRITNILDAAGNSIGYAYNTNGDLVEFVDRLGQTNGFLYTNSSFPHYLTSLIDARGVTPLQNHYDPSGRLIQTTDASGNSIGFGHDLVNSTEYFTNRAGFVTVKTYDTFGNITSVRGPDGLLSTYQYDQNSNLIGWTNGVGLRAGRSLTYDDRDNLTSETDELGNTVRYTYNGMRKVLTYTDPDGNTTTNTWDQSGNLLTTTDPLGRTTSFTYFTNGCIQSMTDPFTNTTLYAYDQFGHLTNETDALGIQTGYTVDTSGNLLSVTRPADVTTDASGSPNVAKPSRLRTPDPSGAITFTTNLTISYEYNANGLLLSTIYPDGSQFKLNYNAIGRVVTTTSRGNRVITTTYNIMGQPLSIDYFGALTESYTYDGDGRVLTHTDRSGKQTQYTYNPTNGYLIRADFSDSTFVSAVRNTLGQVTQETDRCGNTWTYIYDDKGNRTSVTDPLGRQTQYQYNSRAACTAIIAPDGTTSFSYNVLNQNWKIQYPDNTSKEADLQGPIVRVKDQNGNTTEYRYDAIGRLYGILDAVGGQTVIVYDGSGRVTRRDLPGNRSYNFEYDSIGQCTAVAGPGPGRQTYAYDDFGRVATTTDPDGNTTTYTYDPARDWLLTKLDPDGKSTTFTYRNDGLLATRTDRDGLKTTFDYDQYGAVNKITYPDTKSEQFTRDQCGRLLSHIDRAGKETDYTINALGWVTGMKDVLGHQTTYNRDLASGHVNSMTDPISRTFGYTYDAMNRVTGISYPDHTSVSYVRDGLGHVTKFFDQNTKETDYTYDELGRLTQEQRPLNCITKYAYNNQGFLQKVTDANGFETSYTYDSLGDVTGIQHPVGTESMTYDNNGLLLTHQDQNNHTTTYTYDSMNRMASVKDARGKITSYAYDEMSRLKTVTDPLTRQTTFIRDSRGNATEIDHPGSITETAEYDEMDRMTSRTDPLGHKSTFTYDAFGNVTSAKDPLNRETKYTYDDAGELKSRTEAGARTYSYTYDGMGRLATISYPDTTQDEYHYDPIGHLALWKDRGQRLTSYIYDDIGNMTQVIPPDDHAAISFTYDCMGNVLSQTLQGAGTTTYHYDSMGHRDQRTLPTSAVEQLTYDFVGNLILRSDFNQHSTIFTYDELNRLTSKFEGLSGTVFSYNDIGLVTSVSNSWGAISYQYDAQTDFLTQKATPLGALSYTYDKGGNVKSVVSSTPNGYAAAYDYDAGDRLVMVSDFVLGATTYQYDNFDNVIQQNRPGGIVTANSFDNADRLISSATTDAQNNVLTAFGYGYDSLGRRRQASELVALQGQAGTNGWAYNYDSMDRLLSEQLSGSRLPHSGTVSYGYDTTENRLSRSSTLPEVPPAVYSYSPDFRLDSDSYDANGNTLGATVIDPYTGLSAPATDSYDRGNHLTQRQTTLNSSSATIGMAYDGFGQRVLKSVNGTKTHYLLDELNPTGYPQVAEEFTEASGQAPALTRVYSWGNQLLGHDQFVDAQGSWVTSHVVQDGGGSVRALAGLDGLVTDTLDYDSFGNVIARSGSTPAPHQFAGEYYEPELGMYYLRARYYQPRNGRFWNRDAFEGITADPRTLHPYAYCQNNPANLVDPSGNFSLAENNIATTIGVTVVLPIFLSYLNGAISHSFAVAGQGDDLKGASQAQVQYIQQLTAGTGASYGAKNFQAVASGAPFLLQANPYVFIPQSGDQYRLSGFDGDTRIYGARLQSSLLEMDRFVGGTGNDQGCEDQKAGFWTGVGHDLVRLLPNIAKGVWKSTVAFGDLQRDIVGYFAWSAGSRTEADTAAFQPVSAAFQNAQSQAQALGGVGELRVQLAFDALYNAADVPLLGLMHASADFGTALGDGTQESWEAAQAAFGASFGFAVLARRAEIAQEQAEASALTRARITQQSRIAQEVPPRTAAPPNRVNITSAPADVEVVKTPDVAGTPEPAVETPASPPKSQQMLPAPRQPLALLPENAESLNPNGRVTVRVPSKGLSSLDMLRIRLKYNQANRLIASGEQTATVGANVKYRSYYSQRYVRNLLYPESAVRGTRIPTGWQVDEFVGRQVGGRQIDVNQHLLPDYLNSKLGPVEYNAIKNLPKGMKITGFDVQFVPDQ